MASVTADNLLFLLRAKSAEARADAACTERDQLCAVAQKGRDPWLTQARSFSIIFFLNLHLHCSHDDESLTCHTLMQQAEVKTRK